MNRNQIVEFVVTRTAYTLRHSRPQVAYPRGGVPLFYAWPMKDRIVFILDPLQFPKKTALTSSAFKHELESNLRGRRVVVTDSSILAIQVAYNPLLGGDVLPEMGPLLDLTRQPSPLHVPVGVSGYLKKDLWLSILEMDSVLIGGSRRFGKTTLIHGWIQALIHGGQTQLYLWDGKGGLEFNRYAHYPNVTHSVHAYDLVATIQQEVPARGSLFLRKQVSSLPEYNQAVSPAERLPYLVLFFDEIASMKEEALQSLAEMIQLCGAYGIHPVIGTSYPSRKIIKGLLTSNLSMRFCFPVPDHYDSRMVLTRTGAEKMAKVRGRVMFEWGGKMQTAQAFQVERPERGTVIPSIVLPGPYLRLIECSLQEEGAFSIPKLVQWDPSLTPHYARKLIDEFRAKGWVEKVGENNNSHYMTALLRDIYAQNTQAAQTAQTVTNRTDPTLLEVSNHETHE